MSFATSISKVDDFHNCARRYLYEHILKLKPPQTQAMLCGEVYHKAMASVATVKFHGIENPDPEDALAIITQSVVSEFESRLTELKVNPPALEEELFANLQRVAHLWAPHKLWPLEIAPNQALIERKFWGNELGYNGVIDLGSANFPVVNTVGNIKDWRAEPCILDIKVLTGRRRKTERDTRLSAQLALYAAHVDIPRAAFLEIPRNLEKPVKVRTVEYDPQEMKWWRGWLVNQAGHLRIMHEIGDKFIESVGGKPEFLKPNSCELGMLYENFHMCLRSNPLCCAQWCPHYDRCYPYDKGSESPPQSEA
jgi:hypothetical protein